MMSGSDRHAKWLDSAKLALADGSLDDIKTYRERDEAVISTPIANGTSEESSTASDFAGIHALINVFSAESSNFVNGNRLEHHMTYAPILKSGSLDISAQAEEQQDTQVTTATADQSPIGVERRLHLTERDALCLLYVLNTAGAPRLHVQDGKPRGSTDGDPNLPASSAGLKSVLAQVSPSPPSTKLASLILDRSRRNSTQTVQLSLFLPRTTCISCFASGSRTVSTSRACSSGI